MAKIPFEPILVKLGEGEHLTDEFRERYSKFQKVPFIHHDGFRLTESVAIVRYLAREYSVADHWYPKDSQMQARVDEYLEWNHLNVRLFCATYFRNKVLLPLQTGVPSADAVTQKDMKNMKRSLADFERLFLSSGQPFINGFEISFADLQAACEIEQPRIAGYDPRDDFPKIRKWIEDVRNECQPHYDEAHKAMGIWIKTLQKHAAKL